MHPICSWDLWFLHKRNPLYGGEFLGSYYPWTTVLKLNFQIQFMIFYLWVYEICCNVFLNDSTSFILLINTCKILLLTLPLKPYFYDSEFASINLNIEYHWMKYGRRHGGNHFQPFTTSFEHFNVTITLLLFMLTS